MGDASEMKVPILDIRSSVGSLVDDIRRTMNPPSGTQKSLSTLLLYDEMGLKLFQEITYLDEYYLTNAEIEALQNNADTIASRLPDGCRLLELGSGNLRKVKILLDAFERRGKKVEYYALDLSLPELERTFSMIDVAYKHVHLAGLHGTYDDALAWLKELAAGNERRPTCVMTLGSSIGNFKPHEAAEFLSGWAKVLDMSDYVLVGLDACQDPDRVFRAYNDDQRVTERFYRNGLDGANRLLGYSAFRQEDWNITTGFDSVEKKHYASYVALKDIRTKDFAVNANEIVLLEESWKFPQQRQIEMWNEAGLVDLLACSNQGGDYQIHLLSPVRFKFEDKPQDYASTPAPTLTEWRNLWAAWDTVIKMVPKDELLNKPIKLRNDLIFYLGHIPAFADIHHTKATGDSYIEPAHFPQMFERGIDPDVNDPTVCHAHSEIPDTWPLLEELTKYQEDIRARFVENITSGRVSTNRRLARAYWLAYEHEAMHLETFLYMIIQSDKVLPPPGCKPDFERTAEEAAQTRVGNDWHLVPRSQVTLGLEDAENDNGPDRYFGWDVERPSRSVEVKAFEAQSRPVTVGEYARFLEDTQTDSLPASWVGNQATAKTTNGTGSSNALGFLDGKSIRTVYGLVPLQYALDWPVMASYDELARYAKWAGGRIPTLEEARSIYNYVDLQKRIALEKPGELISAVNGHLSNDGVEETPPSSHFVHGSNGVAPIPSDHFVNLTGGCNVGFKHWTPVAVSGNRLRGQGDMGGLWEWTSTPLAAFEGYKAMDLYPGYSADFFDGKHNICLGGSWATVPRIAGRRSFVNWYQHNYPYVWCTARLVRDVA